MVATAAIAAPAFAGADQPRPQAITCEVHPHAHELAVHAHELHLHPQLPDGIEISDFPRDVRHDFRRELRRTVDVDPELEIERRIDEITVIDRSPDPFGLNSFYGDEQSAPVRSCGEPPVVGAIDRVAIEVGKRTQDADLHLDLRYGALAPGLTDEGDGGSEIELEAHLGSGYVEIEMTRNADSATVDLSRSGRPAPSKINLNAGETVPDADVVVGNHSPVAIDGGGGDDRLVSSGGRSAFADEPASLLEGGQGDDALLGGRGSDALLDGPGNDRLDAGPGVDAVVALGHGRDRIDCGPGVDLAVVASKRSPVRHCEEILTGRDIGAGRVVEVAADVPAKLRRELPVQALLSRLTHSR